MAKVVLVIDAVHDVGGGALFPAIRVSAGKYDGTTPAEVSTFTVQTADGDNEADIRKKVIDEAITVLSVAKQDIVLLGG